MPLSTSLLQKQQMREDSNLRKITSNAPIYYYGFEENDDFMATDIIRTTTGSNFKVKHDGQIIGEFHVPAYGRQYLECNCGYC